MMDKKAGILTIMFLSLLVAMSPILLGQQATIMIGTAEEVHDFVRAQGVDGKKRVIHKGDPLYLGDKVSTFTDGYMKIKLLDDTLFTIGPWTTIVLDKFVYDPSTDAGELTASVTKGFFRFVTGKIVNTDPESMTIHAGIATIGVRGTQASGDVKKSRVVVMLEEGEGGKAPEHSLVVSSEVAGKRVETILRKAGEGTIVARGKVPTSPAPVPKRDADKITHSLMSPDERKSAETIESYRPKAGGDGSLQGDIREKGATKKQESSYSSS